MTDARAFNWRFVVPDLTGRILLLPVRDDTTEPAPVAGVLPHTPAGLHAALAAGPYPAVVAPDLTGWAAAIGSDPGELLESLATAVAPGGWLYVGFANSAFPPFRGGLGQRRARRALRVGGLRITASYLPLPDQRMAALLVPTERPIELAFVLRYLFFPYTRATSALAGRVQQAVIVALRLVAMITPHRLRVRFAPAYALVAERGAP